MSRKGHGQIRQSQVITTYGPGALIDLPRHSAIVGGLDTWPNPGSLDEIVEPRLTQQARGDDRRPVADALCAAARAERALGARERHRRMAVPGMVRRAGGRRRRPARSFAASGAP